MTYRLALCALITAALVFSSCGDDPCDGGDECTIIVSDNSDDNGGDNSSNAQSNATNTNNANGDRENQSTNGGPTTRDGLEGFCDHYKACGGTYYGDAQDCIDATINYWGECRETELDGFGDCMMDVDCDDWNPDTYNPASTVCADEWSDVRGVDC